MEINTLLLVAIGIFLLWLGTTNRLKNVGKAWNALMYDTTTTGGGTGGGF